MARTGTTAAAMMAAAIGAAALAPAGAAAQVVDGGYVGGALGILSGDGDARVRFPAGQGRLVGDKTVDYSGWDLGAYGGYRLMTPQGFMLGFELGGSLAWADGGARADIGSRRVRQSLDKNGEVYVAFKGGVPVTDQALLYGIAGLQSGWFDAELRDRTTGRKIGERDTNVGGWQLGLGGEYFLVNNLSARLEWKYQSFNELSFSNAGGGRTKVDPSENVFRMGVSYNF